MEKNKTYRFPYQKNEKKPVKVLKEKDKKLKELKKNENSKLNTEDKNGRKRTN